jgi:hypothetical protein
MVNEKWGQIWVTSYISEAEQKIRTGIERLLGDKFELCNILTPLNREYMICDV